MTDTVQAVETAATDVKKDVENSGHTHLQKLLAWLNAEFSAIGLDIKTELDKIL